MSYFDFFAKEKGISNEDKAEISKLISNEDNHVEVARAVEYYFCYVKSGCAEELEVEAV